MAVLEPSGADEMKILVKTSLVGLAQKIRRDIRNNSPRTESTPHAHWVILELERLTGINLEFLGEGAFREVYGDGKVAFKIPKHGGGCHDNLTEYRIAKLLPAGIVAENYGIVYVLGVPVLAMEQLIRCTRHYDGYSEDLARLAKYMGVCDDCQAGFSQHTGKLVLSDYAL